MQDVAGSLKFAYNLIKPHDIGYAWLRMNHHNSMYSYCDSEMNLSLYGKSFPAHVLRCITKNGFEAIVHFLCLCCICKQFSWSSTILLT